jgi:hypothetical protein
MSEPTDEMIKAEIKAAAAILRDDGMLKHTKDTSERLAKLEARFGGEEEGKPDPKTPPPAKTDPPTPTAAKRKSLWWGEEG